MLFCTNSEQGSLQMHFLNTHTQLVQQFPLGIQTEIHFILRTMHINPPFQTNYKTSASKTQKFKYTAKGWRSWMQDLMASDWCALNFPDIKFDATLPLYHRIFLCLETTFKQFNHTSELPTLSEEQKDLLDVYLMQLMARALCAYLMTKPYQVSKNGVNFGIYSTAPSDLYYDVTGKPYSYLYHPYTWPSMSDCNIVYLTSKRTTYVDQMSDEELALWNILSLLSEVDASAWRLEFVTGMNKNNKARSFTI